MKSRIEVSPSLMCCDCLNIGNEIKALESCNVNSYHIDIIDGLFAKNFAMNFKHIQDIRKMTNKQLVVHMMVMKPSLYLNKINELGDNIVVVMHVESEENIIRNLKIAKKLGLGTGIAINPETKWSVIKNMISYIDKILVMSVNPGFSGQEFIKESINKTYEISKYINIMQKNINIEVDGAIDANKADLLYKAGAHGFILGTKALFKNKKLDNKKEYLRKISSFLDLVGKDASKYHTLE